MLILPVEVLLDKALNVSKLRLCMEYALYIHMVEVLHSGTLQKASRFVCSSPGKHSYGNNANVSA